MKLPPGHRVIHFERIDSTNSEAKRLAEAGERGPLWIWSDEQTQGRGRLGRNWVSEKGNLYVTHLFQVDSSEMVAAQISFIAAIAVFEVAQRFAPERQFLLKWPNDVLQDGVKFCGLLSEILASNPTRIALGCGINLSHAPVLSKYPAASLGSQFTPEIVLSQLAFEFARWLAVWNNGRGFPVIRDEWLSRSVEAGHPVMVDGIASTFLGLAEDGALLVENGNAGRHAVYAGEVLFAPMQQVHSKTP